MRCFTTIVTINSIFSNFVTSIVRNVDRFISLLVPSPFPCHHIRSLQLLFFCRSRIFCRSSLDLILAIEGIHQSLSWTVLYSQLFLVGLEELIVLLSLKDHALMELCLKLVHSSSRCIYHIRVFLLKVVIQLLLVLVCLFLLHLTKQHWIGLRLQLCLFEQFVIS